MGMGSNNSGYGDFTLLSIVADSGRRPSTAACVGCLIKSANPSSPPKNPLAQGWVCFASLSVFDSCAEVLFLVYPHWLLSPVFLVYGKN